MAASQPRAAEMLENRALLTTFTPTTVADLIADMQTANSNGEDDTIDLGGQTFTLTAINNDPGGPISGTAANGLPQILADGGSTLTITGGTIERGAAAVGEFRILQVVNGANLTIDEVTIRGGDLLDSTANSERGGGILNDGTLAIINSTVTENRAHEGGGGVSSFGTLTIVDSLFSDNDGSIAGGGGLAAYGATQIADSTFRGNSGAGGGGLANVGTMLVVRSTFAGNTVTQSGGGLTNTGTLSLANVTISENTALGGGGVSNTGDLTVVNSTIVRNTGTTLAGGVRNWSFFGSRPSISIHNTILANNTGGDYSKVTSTTESGSNNLADDANVPGWIAAVTNLDASLADNGGPTLTHALLTDSNAINAGNNAFAVNPGPDATIGGGDDTPLATDHRGESRFVGTVDIGAFEADEAASLVVTTDQDIVNPRDNLTSLREALAFANSDPDFSEITFGDGTSLTGGTNFTDTAGDTITLGGTQLEISSDLTITGPGADLLTVSGDGQSRVFDIANGDHDVTFDSLTATEGSVVTENGGGILNQSSGIVTITDAIVSDNRSATGSGGGIAHNNGTLVIERTSVSQNTSNRNGGGILISFGTVIIVDSTIDGNSATSPSLALGGGIRAFGGTLSVYGSTVSGNSANFGGGILSSAPLTIINSTISGNNATSNAAEPNPTGGGVFSGNSLVVINSTIAANSANMGGGIIRSDTALGVFTISNSIVAGNTAPTDTDVFGTATANNSLIGIPSELTISDILDPNLADNGGPTLTYALVAGSPAINAGDDSLALDENGTPLTADQRGESRFVGMVDIGAFEASAATLAVPINDVTVEEDAADQAIDLSGTFANSATATLSVSSDDPILAAATLTGTDLTLSFGADEYGSAEITVTANDGSATTTETFTVTVNPVNDAPTVVAELSDLTVDEGSADVEIDLSPVFEDIDSPNLIFTAVSSDGTVVDTSVSDTDLTLSFPADGNGTATVTVTADDGELTVSDTFEITVNAVNDAGTFAGDLSATVDEDTSDSGTATFADAADGYSTNNFVLDTDATNGTATIDVDGNWTYSPNTDFNGTDSFTVSVTDDDGNVEFQVISITVNPVNDDGTFGGDLSATVDEDTSASGTATFADAADGYSTDNFMLDSGPANGAATVGVGGDWTYTPNPDFNGSDSFTVKVTDDDGNVETQVINVTVDPVNDAPTVDNPLLDVTVDEDAADRIIDLTSVFDDIDSTLTFTAVTGNGSLVNAAVNGTQLTLSLVGDANGSTTVTVTANDGALTVDDTFTVTVNAVNDAPTVVSGLTDLTVDEGSADVEIDLVPVFADIDDPTLTYSATSSDGAVVTGVTGNTLTLSFPVDGVATITATATDNEGASVSETFTVTVNDVTNEPDPGVEVVDGKLIITGTDGDDEIFVKKFWGRYYVYTNIEGFEFTRIRASQVDEICVDGGDGNDSIVMGWFVYVPTTLNGGAGDDYIRGGLGNDVIDGGDGDDCLHGSSGHDTIHGGDGNDWIEGGWGNDIVYAGSGNDRVWGGSGNDILLGQSGNDRLYGGWGRDIIIAGEGADRLKGQSHDDILITGDTNWDDDEVALKTMRDIWTGSGSADSRAQAIQNTGLEVFHDDDIDYAWGGWGLDWLLFDNELDHAC